MTLKNPTMKQSKELSEIHLSDLALVGGKNSSLGEMFPETVTSSKGIKVPDGYAVTSACYWNFSKWKNQLVPKAKGYSFRIELEDSIHFQM